MKTAFVSIFVLLSALFCTSANAEVTAVDAFTLSVKLGCLPTIANNIPIESFVRQVKGSPMPPANADYFLRGRRGTAYVLPFPNHQFVLAMTEENRACSIFVRRIDRDKAEEELGAMLSHLGFLLIHPKETRAGLNTKGYAREIKGNDIEVVASFSVSSEGTFNAVATVFQGGRLPPK